MGLHALVWKRYASMTARPENFAGEGRPSTRCGNVAVVALYLLVNRKICFYGV